MTDDYPSPAMLTAIRKRLNRFSCLRTPPALTASEVRELQGDLVLFNHLSDYQTLGICADSVAQGKAALITFLAALGVTISVDLPERRGAVYLKFNTLKGAWYLDDYTGSSRGVLITFHTSEPELDALVGTYGPLPFDLFEGTAQGDQSGEDGD